MEVSEAVGRVHVMLMPPALQAIGATPCTRVALLPAPQAVPRAQDAVQAMVLHPVQPPGNSKDDAAPTVLLAHFEVRLVSALGEFERGPGAPVRYPILSVRITLPACLIPPVAWTVALQRLCGQSSRGLRDGCKFPL